MTDPKKPRSASAMPLATPAPLTNLQLHIAQLFAAMDDESQAPMLAMMEAMAVKRPRHKRPALRLVNGGAQ
jgi:hypothetical protein